VARPASVVPTPPVAPAVPEPTVAPIAWKAVTGVRAGDRPLLVWIGDASAHASTERRAFDDVDVRLAARAFRVVRIDPAAAALDPMLAVHARSAPAAVVFAPDLSRATVAYGASLEARTVFAALRATALTYERVDLTAAVARARVLLDEEARLERERTSLVGAPPTLAAPATSDPRPARIAAIDVRLAALHAELDGLFPHPVG
jgi:hypothetical protein